MTFSASYRRYVLGALTAVYTLNFIDRGLIILLLQSIKQDLNLSDTQLGFLTGSAFGLFYGVMGIPLARWADRADRVAITSLSIGMWGLAVMACLAVGNFAQLVLARVGAAIGEAGCKPPTYSLIGDYFPSAAERPRAMAVYWLANPLSALIGFIVGGWLNDLYGWRATFFIMGLPAVLIALIVKWTVVEPRAFRAAPGELPAMRDVLGALWRQRASRHISLGVILFYAMMFGLAPWYGAFLIRNHGFSTAELGLWLGIVFGVAGVLGILLGGYVAGRWLPDNERAQIRLTAVIVAVLVPGYAVFVLVPTAWGALCMLAALAVAFNFILGPAYALMQRLVPDHMRATAMAWVMLLSNLTGMVLGAQIVGLLSDALAHPGSDGLRGAMLLWSFLGLWSAFHFWRVGRTVRDDLVAIES